MSEINKSERDAIIVEIEQRLGLAGILTITALHEARSAGCNLAVLHSTPMAQKLYQSLGFATFAEFRLFASQDVQV